MATKPPDSADPIPRGPTAVNPAVLLVSAVLVVMVAGLVWWATGWQSTALAKTPGTEDMIARFHEQRPLLEEFRTLALRAVAAGQIDANCHGWDPEVRRRIGSARMDELAAALALDADRIWDFCARPETGEFHVVVWFGGFDVPSHQLGYAYAPGPPGEAQDGPGSWSTSFGSGRKTWDLIEDDWYLYEIVSD